MSRFLMRRTLAATISLAILGGVGCIHTTEYVYVDQYGNRVSTTQFPNQIRLELPETSSAAVDLTGKWAAGASTLHRSMDLTLEIKTVQAGVSRKNLYSLSGMQIDGLPISSTAPNGPVHFSIQRKPGKIEFEGALNGDVAEGTAKLLMDEAYQKEIADATGEPVSPADSIRLFMVDLSAIDARQLREAGYHFKLDDIFRLKQSGVTTEYAIQARKAGYEFTAEQLVRLRNNGITPSFIADLGATEMVPDSDGIVRLRQNGVNASFVQQLKDAGCQFTVDEIVRFRQNGIAAAYISSLKKAGYEFKAAEIVRLRQNGITEQYASALVVPGRANLGVEEIIKLRNRGMDAETIRKIRE